MQDTTIAVVGDGFGSLMVYSTAVYVGFRREQLAVYGNAETAVFACTVAVPLAGQKITDMGTGGGGPAVAAAMVRGQPQRKDRSATALQPARP